VVKNPVPTQRVQLSRNKQFIIPWTEMGALTGVFGNNDLFGALTYANIL